MNKTIEFSQDDIMQHIEKGNKLLQTTHMTLEEAWTFRSIVEHFLTTAKQDKFSLECVNACAKMKVKVEERLGWIIALMEANDPDAVHYGPATVRSLKIRKSDVSVWKQLAEIPDADIERYFSIISECGETISTKKVLEERAEDPLLMVVDSIRGMVESGDEEGAHAAIRSVRALITRAPQPIVHDPMPKDFSDEDRFRARGMGVSLEPDERED